MVCSVNWAEISAGEPHGSIFGPGCLIYFQMIYSFLLTMLIFADDNTLYTKEKNLD